jgi:hypothetical protein
MEFKGVKTDEVGNIGYYEITNSASCAVLSIKIIKPGSTVC